MPRSKYCNFKVERIDLHETPQGLAVMIQSRCYAVHRGDDFRCQNRSWVLARVGEGIKTKPGPAPEINQLDFLLKR